MNKYIGHQNQIFGVEEMLFHQFFVDSAPAGHDVQRLGVQKMPDGLFQRIAGIQPGHQRIGKLLTNGAKGTVTVIESVVQIEKKAFHMSFSCFGGDVNGSIA